VSAEKGGQHVWCPNESVLDVGNHGPRPALDVDLVQAEPTGRGHLNLRQFPVGPAIPDARDGLRVEAQLARQGAPRALAARLADVVVAPLGDPVLLVHVGNGAVGRLPARLALVALPQHPEGHPGARAWAYR